MEANFSPHNSPEMLSEQDNITALSSQHVIFINIQMLVHKYTIYNIQMLHNSLAGFSKLKLLKIYTFMYLLKSYSKI